MPKKNEVPSEPSRTAKVEIPTKAEKTAKTEEVFKLKGRLVVINGKKYDEYKKPDGTTYRDPV